MQKINYVSLLLYTTCIYLEKLLLIFLSLVFCRQTPTDVPLYAAHGCMTECWDAVSRDTSCGMEGEEKGEDEVSTWRWLSTIHAAGSWETKLNPCKEEAAAVTMRTQVFLTSHDMYVEITYGFVQIWDISYLHGVSGFCEMREKHNYEDFRFTHTFFLWFAF